jgi:cytochrome c oxidase assembly protein subunit 11
MSGKTEASKTIRQLIFVVVGMFGFGFAMVPLYDVLCDVTGFNGKTAGKYTATEVQDVREDRLVTIQFLANNNANMPWEFRPKVRTMKVHPGKLNTAEFYVRNVTSETMVAQAVPSVTPFHAAEFLHKTECFCFEQQQLEAREDLDMPLRFIIDSQIPEDVKTLTLSYTLYDVTEQIELATN